MGFTTLYHTMKTSNGRWATDFTCLNLGAEFPQICLEGTLAMSLPAMNVDH
jgi:hypothetical protein